MLKNYLLIAFRNLSKNLTFSLINISGLAVGIACSLLIVFYVAYERSYENFHENADDIFRITLDIYNGNEFEINDCETYQTLGPELTELMPEVKGYVRLFHWGRAHVKTDVNALYEDKIYLADPSVFDIFSINVLHGEPQASFDQPHQVLLSERLAIKAFGKSNVVGETFFIGRYEEPMIVAGVMEDLPHNTHLKFDMLVSHITVEKWLTWYPKYAWGANNEYTYLHMEPGVSVQNFNEKLREYSLNHEQIEEEIVISERIGDIHLYSNKSFEPEVNGSAQVVNFMALIGVFILLLAWVNYTNLSTSKAVNRAKEVGIRKVVGSSRYQLIKQFLMESFLINLAAAFLAYTFVQLAIPYFRTLTGQDLPVEIFNSPMTWTFLAGIVLIGTLLSGIYPAFALSSFSPATVLKGKFSQSKSGNMVRKVLVIFQFAATVILLTISFTVSNQMNFLLNKDLGVDIDKTFVIHRPSYLNVSDSTFDNMRDAYLNELRSLAAVKGVAQSQALPGDDFHELGSTTGVWKATDDQEVVKSHTYYVYDIDENYLNTLNIELIAGRNFKADEESGNILINERAVALLGFASPEDAVGKQLKYGGDGRDNIIGVISNFHQRSPKEDYIPLLFNYDSYGVNFIVQSKSGQEKEVIEQAANIWEDYFSGAAFDVTFLDDRYNLQYKTDQTLSSTTAIFTGLSLLISLLGLFGLSSFTILQRKKEIGVRKVLGASVPGLIGLLSKDFLKLVSISSLLSLPLAIYLADLWLQNYSSRISLSWWLFAFPIVLILLVAFLSVLGQTIKTTVANPVDSLRHE